MSASLYDLMKQCKERNKHSLLKFILKFRPLVDKYKRKLNYEDAENELVEKLILIVYNMPPLRDEGKIVSYVAMAMHNTYIELSKKKQKINYTETSLDVLDGHSLFHANNNNDLLCLIIKSAMLALNTRQKSVIRYKYYYGFTDMEIAKILGISRQAIYKNKKNALSRLKSELQ